MSDPREPIDPQVQALFDMMAPGRATRVLEAQPLRDGFAALAPLLSAGAPEVAAEREIQIPGPAGPVRALVYDPGSPAPRPGLLLIHGGGWVIMSPESHAGIARRLCVGADCVVVSIDYRLAPEHRYPAALDDCVACFRWLRTNGSDIGIDPSRLAVCGDSAGGQLTAATTLRLLGAGEAPPAANAMLCPVTDMALDTDSYRTFAPGDPVLDDGIMEFFRDSYVDPGEWDEPDASPLRADLEGFPPTLVLSAGIDPLCDDGTRFSDALERAGAQVEAVLEAGMPHDFFLFPGIDAGPRALEQVASFLKAHLG